MESRIEWAPLSKMAWSVRENAYIYGDTKVGAALLSDQGKIYTGCNVEHMFRSHDFHAETNAIGSMVAAGDKKIIAILVAAKREKFTPCGGCLDWIFQFGGRECHVGFQAQPNGPITHYTASELMPHYPS